MSPLELTPEFTHIGEVFYSNNEKCFTLINHNLGWYYNYKLHNLIAISTKYDYGFLIDKHTGILYSNSGEGYKEWENAFIIRRRNKKLKELGI